MSKQKKKVMTTISTGRGPGILGSKMSASDRKAVLAYNKSKRDEMTPEQKKVDYQQRVKKSRSVARKARKVEASNNLKQFAKDMMATEKAREILRRMKKDKK